MINDYSNELKNKYSNTKKIRAYLYINKILISFFILSSLLFAQEDFINFRFSL